MGKKIWVKPVVKVLVKGTSEEAVLTSCKSIGLVSIGPEGIANGCSFETGGSYPNYPTPCSAQVTS